MYWDHISHLAGKYTGTHSDIEKGPASDDAGPWVSAHHDLGDDRHDLVMAATAAGGAVGDLLDALKALSTSEKRPLVSRASRMSL